MSKAIRTSARLRGIAAVSENPNIDSVSIATAEQHSPFKIAIQQYQYQSLDSPTTESATGTANKKRKRVTADANIDADHTYSTPTKKRRSSGYAPASKYAHLPELQDIIVPGLICVFVGLNPGIRTATAGHAYAHPSNLFWKLLHSSGCTDVRLRPEQDVDLPQLYSMGNTNIVSRPSKNGAELSKAEMAAGTPILEEKFRKFKPEAVCIVGKSIWEAIWRYKYKRELKKDEFRYGWQEDRERMGKTDEWSGSRVYVTCSTSGLSASLRPPEKEAIWKPFGAWVSTRRRERAAVHTQDESLVANRSIEKPEL